MGKENEISTVKLEEKELAITVRKRKMKSVQ